MTVKPEFIVREAVKKNFSAWQPCQVIQIRAQNPDDGDGVGL
jgi:hypothetical protein